MSSRVYPRTVWVLMPSFKPVAVEVVNPYGEFWGKDYGDVTVTGKRYALNQMHESKESAIAVGRLEIAKQYADIAKRTDNMNKRIAALDKAEGK